MILISHKLDEILHATDRVTIMRNGAVVAAWRHGATRRRRARARDDRPRGVAALDRRGARPPRASRSPTTRRRPGRRVGRRGVVLAIRDARVPRTRRPHVCSTACRLDVRARRDRRPGGRRGQRPEGARRSALEPRCRSTSGSVEVDGRADRRAAAPGAMAAAGVGVIPEDRHDSGCDPRAVGRREPRARRPRRAFAPRGFVNRRRLRAHAAQLVDEFEITTRVGRRADALAVGRQPAARRARP